MIGFYDYTVVLTYIGLFSGLYGMYQVSEGNIFLAVAALMFAGFCDMFDGPVARTKKNRSTREKRFGTQIDSLNDLLCFGVLPSTIGVGLGVHNTFFWPVLFLFPLGGLIRLAYFNVLEEERTGILTKGQKTFTGLPITSSALLLPLVFLLKDYINVDFVYVYATAMSIITVLFVMTFKLPKPKTREQIIMAIVGLIILYMLYRWY